MKIKLLLRFEDFYQVLSNTSNRVFQESVLPISKFSITDILSKKLAYSIPSLNVIFSAKFSSHIYPIILKQYAYSSVNFIFLLKCIYIYCLVRVPLLRFIFADKIFINSKNSIFDRYVIQGGSSKIRFIDFENNISIIALKDGYSAEKYFYREVYFRSSEFSKYALPIVKVNPHNFSYIESYFSSCEYLYYNGKSSMLLRDQIKNVYSSYNKFLPNVGLASLDDYINRSLTFARSIGVAKYLVMFLNDLSNINFYLFSPKHFSHGDLQVGNFLIHSSELLLFDWESCSSRVVYYDLTVLESRARLDPSSFIRLLTDIYWHDQKEFYLKNLDVFLHVPSSLSNKSFAVFLAMENLLYYSEDPCGSKPSHGALRYISSLEPFVFMLANDGFADG